MHATQFGNKRSYGFQGGGQNRNRQHGAHQAAPVAKASVLRTVNFKRLAVAAGGSDELGSILGMTVGRLQALEQGQDFSDETAFHLETELGLPSGWFDQKDPVLPAVIQRTDDTDEIFLQQGVEVSQKQEQNKDLANLLAPKAANEQADSVATKEPDVRSAPEPTLATTVVQSSVNLEVAEMSTTSVVDAINAARQMRRNNLTMLTSWPKSKSGLARLLGKTPANISHLIHGEKNFDRDAALEIERATGLPDAWFEAPRTAEEVPGQVVTKMTGVEAPGLPPVAAAAAAPAGDAAPRKRGRPRKTTEEAGTAQVVVAEVAAPAKKRGRPPKVAAAPAAVVAVAPAVAAQVAPVVAAEPGARKRGRPRKNPLPVEASTGGLAPSAAAPARLVAPADKSVAMPVGPVMTEGTRKLLRESEGQMGPIAEALVKTIIEKSRNGGLSEKAAYKMLSEVMG